LNRLFPADFPPETPSYEFQRAAQGACAVVILFWLFFRSHFIYGRGEILRLYRDNTHFITLILSYLDDVYIRNIAPFSSARADTKNFSFLPLLAEYFRHGLGRENKFGDEGIFVIAWAIYVMGRV